MNISQQYKYRLLAAATSALLLSACGGSSGSTEATATTGRLGVAITDAPVDYAEKVNVQFTGIELKPKSGNSFIVDLGTMDIDLYALQGGASALMLDDLEVEAGEYTWMRLAVNAERGVDDSYLQTDLNDDTTKTSLWVPSGSQSGLKLNNGFIITAGGSLNLTIDFDLRKSISNPVGQDDYILKPSLRVVDNTEVGEITGSVDESLLSVLNENQQETCTFDEEGNAVAAVYIFSAEVTEANVDDIDLAEEGVVEDLGGADPITTAAVIAETDENNITTYHYTAAFLSAGNYTVALTCQAANDDPLVDNNAEGTSDVEFFGATSAVSVEADLATTLDFAPEVP